MRRHAAGWLVGFALLASASPALADARAEARRHFRAGMKLIGQGKYEVGVAELLEAYAIKPHPNVLYNVARAWEEAGRDEAALDYYRRYLAFAPPDAAVIEQAIGKLEAKLAAKVPVAPPPDATPVVDPAATDRLTAAAERLEQALAKVEGLAAGPAKVAPAAPAKLSREELVRGAEAAESGTAAYEEVVVSASRRTQRSIEAPAATTILTADEIRASGAGNLPDLLRRVPGIDVMSMGVSEHAVSIRGLNNRISNKVLVLVDGRSVYQDFVGATFWSWIDVPLEDIERIEVVRGPGSALYGANAAFGVVNVITRRPGELVGSRVTARGGAGNTLEGTYAFGGSAGPVGYRAHVGYVKSDKYSRDVGEGEGFTPYWDDPARDDLSLEQQRFGVDLRWALGGADALSVGAGVIDGQSELYPIGALRNFTIDGTASHARAELAWAPLKLKAFWNRTDLRAGPQYWPEGALPIDTTVRQDVVDVELQGDFAFELAGHHHLTVGAGWRQKQIEMDWLKDDGQREIHLAAFLQEEWAPIEAVRVVGSARADRHPLLEAPVLSPRGALLWLPRPDQALRLSYGTSFRVPSFVESYVEVDPPVASVAGVLTQFRGDEALSPERVATAELGWRGSFVDRVELDVALYRMTIEELIVQGGLTAPGFSERLDPATGAFVLGVSRFENSPGTITALGGELGVRTTPVDGLDLRLAYAHEALSDDAGDPASEQTPRHKLAAGVTGRLPLGLVLNADLSYVTATEWVERVFDPSAPGGIRLEGYPLPSAARLDAKLGWRTWQEKLELAVSGTNLLGSSYREHPFGNELDPRLFGSASVEF